MSKHRRQLGNGQVSLLGLNQFGKNPGMSPITGAAIGAGAGLAAEFIAAKAMNSSNADAIGFGAGILATGALWAMPKTRHAAYGAAIGTFLASGIPWLKRKFGAGGMNGVGIPQINYLNGLGVHQVEYLNGLGVHTLEPVRHAVGTIPGVAGVGNAAQAGIQMGPDSGNAPVDLLGPMNSNQRMINSQGGPQISGLSAAYGATLFGPR